MAPKQISYSAAAIQVYRISTAPAVYSKLKVVDGKGRKMGLNCWSKNSSNALTPEVLKTGSKLRVYKKKKIHTSVRTCGP